MSVCQQVSKQFFPETGHRIFLKFYSKLEGFRVLKLFKSSFSEKFSFWGKSPEVLPKQSYLDFAKNLFNPLMSFFTLKMVHRRILYVYAKNSYLGKIWFFSYGLKCSQLIRLQYLIINISERNQVNSQIFSAWRRSSKKGRI